MGKVKAMMMEMQEEAQYHFLEGDTDARQCAMELSKAGMDPDEIEGWIDGATAERTDNVMNKLMERINPCINQ